MAASREVHLNDLPPELVESAPAAAGMGGGGMTWEQSLQRWADQELAGGAQGLLDRAVPTFERIMIESALKRTSGRRQDAARLLGWGRNTLTRKIKELGMDEGATED
jgi:two-component system nitrogen regulation response regulator GlnG